MIQQAIQYYICILTINYQKKSYFLKKNLKYVKLFIVFSYLKMNLFVRQLFFCYKIFICDILIIL